MQIFGTVFGVVRAWSFCTKMIVKAGQRLLLGVYIVFTGCKQGSIFCGVETANFQEVENNLGKKRNNFFIQFYRGCKT